MFVDHSRSLVDEIDALGAPKRMNGSPERTVQVTLKRWLERVMPGVMVAAVENERRAASTSGYSQARFHQARKAAGTVAGFPDLIVDTVDQGVFYVEVKAPGSGVVSVAQSEVHQRLRSHGRAVIVADAIESLRLGMQRAGLRTIEAAGQPVAVAKVRVAKSKLPADEMPF